MCTVLSVFNVDHWNIGLMHAFFLDRGMPAKEARSRKRVEHLIHEAERSNAATAEIEELLSGGSGFIRVSIATAIICLAEQHT